MAAIASLDTGKSVFFDQICITEMLTQSWASFAEGKNNFFTNEVLSSIGQHYNRSVAQVTMADPTGACGDPQISA